MQSCIKYLAHIAKPEYIQNNHIKLSGFGRNITRLLHQEIL